MPLKSKVGFLYIHAVYFMTSQSGYGFIFKYTKRFFTDITRHAFKRMRLNHKIVK